MWGNAASGTANPLQFTVTNPAPTLSALFVPVDAGQCALTVIPSGLGSVTVQPRANAYTAGTGILLTAQPEPGQQFLGWGGDAAGAENPLPLVMDATKTVTARFSRQPTLSVDSMPEAVVSDGCRLTLQGDFGAVYQLEVSTNLADWDAPCHRNQLAGPNPIHRSDCCGGGASVLPRQGAVADWPRHPRRPVWIRRAAVAFAASCPAQPTNRRAAMLALCPPKPKELLMKASTRNSLAVLGT